MTRWTKTVTIILAVAAVLSIGTTAAFAQGPQDNKVNPGAQALIAALADLSGKSLPEIWESVEPGNTLADVAIVDGVDPTAVVDQAAASITERVEQAVANGRLTRQQADEILSTLEADLTDLMSQPIPQRDRQRPRANRIVNEIRDRIDRGLVGTLSEMAGLEPRELLEQARAEDLKNLTKIAEANSLDPNQVVDTAAANITEQVNSAVSDGKLSQEQADRVLAGLEGRLNAAMHHPLPPAPRQIRDRVRLEAGREVLQTVSELTGTDVSDLINQVRDGTTIKEILEDAGVPPSEVTDVLVAQASEHLATAVENGRLSQERADALLETLSQRIEDRLGNAQ